MTREQLAENFGENLERERLILGYSQQEMAKALDMSLSSYKRLINGETNKVDLYTGYRAWQLTGKPCDELCGTSTSLSKTFDSIRHLSDAQMRFIDAVIEFEREFSKNLDDSKNPDDYVTMLVPTGNMMDGMIYDSGSLKKINVSAYRKRYKERIDCAILITSNHMHPVYNTNDILLISRSPIRDGDTGIFINKVTGLAYIRKFYQTSPCRLVPIVNYGQTFYIDSNNQAEMAHWIKFGYVITKIRSNPDIISYIS